MAYRIGRAWANDAWAAYPVWTGDSWVGGASEVTISPAPVILHAPQVTATVVAPNRPVVGAASVVVHAPRVATAAGALTRTVGAPGVVLHAPAVQVAKGAVTRSVSAGPVVLHAPRVATATGGVSVAIGAAHFIVHAPQLRGSTSPPQATVLGNAGAVVLSAPALAAAYSLRVANPPLRAAADNLYTDVALY